MELYNTSVRLWSGCDCTVDLHSSFELGLVKVLDLANAVHGCRWWVCSYGRESMFKTVSLMLNLQWKDSRELSEFSSEEAIPKKSYLTYLTYIGTPAKLFHDWL